MHAHTHTHTHTHTHSHKNIIQKTMHENFQTFQAKLIDANPPISHMPIHFSSLGFCLKCQTLFPQTVSWLLLILVSWFRLSSLLSLALQWSWQHCLHPNRKAKCLKYKVRRDTNLKVEETREQLNKHRWGAEKYTDMWNTDGQVPGTVLTTPKSVKLNIPTQSKA